MEKSDRVPKSPLKNCSVKTNNPVGQTEGDVDVVFGGDGRNRLNRVKKRFIPLPHPKLCVFITRRGLYGFMVGGDALVYVGVCGFRHSTTNTTSDRARFRKKAVAKIGSQKNVVSNVAIMFFAAPFFFQRKTQKNSMRCEIP